MTKVISLKERSEIWQRAYMDADLAVYVSNHGRFKFSLNEPKTSHCLSTVNSVELLSSTSKLMESALQDLYADDHVQSI